MEPRQLNGETISARQLSVAVLVAGLSPAAALAGSGQWLWMLVWTAVGVVLGALVLWRVKGRQIYRGGTGVVLRVLYCGWAVVLTARVLSRMTARLELTSGGSPRFWLLLLALVPLVWMCWGKTAPFLRAVEIFWLAMAVVLALVLVFGLVKVEWRYVWPEPGDWRKAALTVGEVMAPALFVLPYIYKVGDCKKGWGLIWLGGSGAASAALCLITVGILGGVSELVPQPFFVAAGLLGESARCEGLLSVLWLLPDLTMAGLLCRVWGERRWPALGVLPAAALSLTEFPGSISSEFCFWGTTFLLGLTVLLPGRRKK